MLLRETKWAAIFVSFIALSLKAELGENLVLTNVSRPIVAVEWAQEAGKDTALLEQLGRLREAGAGGVLVAVAEIKSTTWPLLARVAARAEHEGLQLGLRYVPGSTETGISEPWLQKLVWTSYAVTNEALMDPQLYASVRDAVRFQSLTSWAVPETEQAVQPQHLLEMPQGGSVPPGAWRIYHFGCADVLPRILDVFDDKAVVRQLNHWLKACQTNMGQYYGRTMLWCEFTGPSKFELVWPRDLEAQFLKRSGFTLERYLPVLAGCVVGGEETAVTVRRHVAQATRDAWRKRFGQNVRELVSEAGLETAIAIEQAPVDPEEVAVYFQRPMLNAGVGFSARSINLRAAGGARVMGRRFVMGTVDLIADNEKPHTANWKPVVDALLADGVTRLLFTTGGRMLEDANDFQLLRTACHYAQACQTMLQKGEAVVDMVMWVKQVPLLLAGYTCDAVNDFMLASARVQDGSIRFDSERVYAGLAVTAEVLVDAEAVQLVKQIAKHGGMVWLVPNRMAQEQELFQRVCMDGGKEFRVITSAGNEGLPMPDFEWHAKPEGLSLRFVHRRSLTQEIYFVVNESDMAGEVTATFRDFGKGVPERWEPMTATSSMLNSTALRMYDGRVGVSFQMAAHDSCFILFER